ncbi:MAG: hypothetical protein AVDCRST_MAG43-1394 [uncultured Thermomicrobiales bacterium]|uniref:Uncharacterized protein n=1 Tax=uncultured Thermomicrobiales bacterium TaxID=1645740 RepID=A0A6J4UPN2_9BACT|nr:MAG: hypothetical protein AVDCRST_MAG43-1394 [uncultured Thermomicrobiales bacterium]
MDERANGPELPGSGDAPPSNAEYRPIPTDGLGESMPDWLQRPPAWRGMTVREPAQHDLPPPDTSVIDPRTMLELGDLPVWLQRIAARSMGSEATGAQDVEPGLTDPTEPTGQDVSSSPPEPAPDPGTLTLGTSEEAVLRRKHTLAPVSGPYSPKIMFRPSSQERHTAWWTSRAALAALAALVVFLIVWLVLVAT